VIEYDEFGLFHENAEEFGLPFDGPPVVRRESVPLPDERRLSALVWGTGPAELVLLHGGGQNAHTWDTVAMALGIPLVAIDLPGHGHSDGPRPGGGEYDAAQEVAVAIRALSPDARAVVGMSYGGLTTLALVQVAPELLRRMVLVDVTPGVTPDKSKAIADFLNGPDSFPDFDEILARTVEFNPTRSVSSLRRGILHNAEQQPDGTWVWRHQRHHLGAEEKKRPARPEPEKLWSAVSEVRVPLMLVRGMRTGSVVDDADEAELLRRCPTARVEHVDGAGHSVQGDAPVELAALLTEFLETT
jgi:pimeloyl-ACP methyl ester carboxylesterase